MFFEVTIGADKLEIREVIVAAISIAMVDVEYLYLRVSASFAGSATCFYEPKFDRSLLFYLVFWASSLIFDTCPILIRAASAARTFVISGKYGRCAH